MNMSPRGLTQFLGWAQSAYKELCSEAQLSCVIDGDGVVHESFICSKIISGQLYHTPTEITLDAAGTGTLCECCKDWNGTGETDALTRGLWDLYEYKELSWKNPRRQWPGSLVVWDARDWLSQAENSLWWDPALAREAKDVQNKANSYVDCYNKSALALWLYRHSYGSFPWSSAFDYREREEQYQQTIEKLSKITPGLGLHIYADLGVAYPGRLKKMQKADRLILDWTPVMWRNLKDCERRGHNSGAMYACYRWGHYAHWDKGAEDWFITPAWVVDKNIPQVRIDSYDRGLLGATAELDELGVSGIELWKRDEEVVNASQESLQTALELAQLSLI